MNTSNKLVVYFDSEEHLVRRLGAAVISCWRELPAEVRLRLYERSVEIHDDHGSERLEEEFRRFLSEHSRPPEQYLCRSDRTE